MNNLRKVWRVLRGREDAIDFGKPWPGQRVEIDGMVYRLTSISTAVGIVNHGQVEMIFIPHAAYMEKHKAHRHGSE